MPSVNEGVGREVGSNEPRFIGYSHSIKPRDGIQRMATVLRLQKLASQDMEIYGDHFEEVWIPVRKS